MNDRSNDELIFISIASYRDPQLKHTVQDCVAKASKPARLRFGICWQRSCGEELSLNIQDARARIIEADWRLSRGACWARSEAMTLWEGEPWFLQLDSHCRMAPGWDRTLIDMARTLPGRKAVISTYAAPFQPGGDELLLPGPLQIYTDYFDQDGIPRLKPKPISTWRPTRTVFRARFIGAGFLFTAGRFIHEVRYDPELYFLGEEVVMSLRAFTAGYDLYHPHKTLVWHEYTRPAANKHWNDHNPTTDLVKDWRALDRHAKAKVKAILAGTYTGAFGLGNERSLKEFEEYVGIRFSDRRISLSCIRGDEPPANLAQPEWWTAQVCWRIKLRAESEWFSGFPVLETSSWRVAFQDESGKEMYHREISKEDLRRATRDSVYVVLSAEFESKQVPVSWTIKPNSVRSGRGRGIKKPLKPANFQQLCEVHLPRMGGFFTTESGIGDVWQVLISLSMQRRLPEVLALHLFGLSETDISSLDKLIVPIRARGVIVHVTVGGNSPTTDKKDCSALVTLFSEHCSHFARLSLDVLQDSSYIAMLRQIIACRHPADLSIIAHAPSSLCGATHASLSAIPADTLQSLDMRTLLVLDSAVAEFYVKQMATSKAASAAAILINKGKPRFSGCFFAPTSI